MKAIEYFITEKGQKIANDLKYLEEEKELLNILKKGRKNKLQILLALQKKGYKSLNWYQIEKKLELLQRDKLIEILR